MKLLSKHLVLTLAIALSVSACAKKKDGGSSSQEAKNSAPAPAPTTTDPKNGVPAPGTPSASGPATPGTSVSTTTTSTTLPKPNGNGLPPAPTPDASKDKNKNKDKKDKPPQGTHSKPDDRTGGGTLPPPPQPPPLAGGGGEVPGSGPAPLPPGGSPGAPIGGGVISDDRFSGSAPDSLRDVLRQMMDQKPADQVERNKAFAQKITQASLRIEPSGRFFIDVVLGNENAQIGLTGILSNGSSSLATNAPGASGTFTCVDAVPDQAGYICESSVAKIKYGHATVNIIFRRTNVYLKGVFNDLQCMSKACDKFYYLLRKSDLYILDKNTFKSAFMDSFEVIYGRSEFRFLARTKENEVIKVAGPLPNPAYLPLDTPTDRRLTQTELIDPATGQMGIMRMNESLGDVRLVQNDGRGSINLFVKMPVLENGEYDVFQLQIRRIVKPVRLPGVND